MTQTFTLRHDCLIRVEATDKAEARRIAAGIARKVRAALPVGATLSLLSSVERARP